MSDFDENPFGEPTINNPFDDPAVQNVAKNTNTQIRVEDYNPFGDQQPDAKPMPYNQTTTQPAVMQATQAPPSYSRSGQQSQPQTKPVLNTAELQRRQEELERKEEELRQREQQLLQNPYNVRRNNWPPLPEQCCFQPCFYQDIQLDIPLEFQKIVRQLYYLWIFHGIILLVNVLGGVLATNFKVIALGIVYVFLFTPFSYVCWFRPAYKAFRNDSSFNFMVFFFIFFFQFIITLFHAIGLPDSGTIGLITAIEQFQLSGVTDKMIALFELLIAIGFGCAAAADLFLITKIHRIYRSTGASFAKAQAEFTTEFLKNQHVRTAATNVATAAVQSQFNNNPPSNRY